MQQFLTWFLASLLFAQQAPSYELHAASSHAPCAASAAAAHAAAVRPNDSPPILP